MKLIEVKSRIKVGYYVQHTWWCLTNSKTELVWSKITSITTFSNDAGKPNVTISVKSTDRKFTMHCDIDPSNIKAYKKYEFSRIVYTRKKLSKAKVKFKKTPMSL